MYKNEKEALAALTEQMREIWYDIFLYKIRDEGNSLKPFDCIACYNKKALAIEAKYLKTKSITPERVMEKLEAHQFISLVKFIKAGGIALVIAYHAPEDTFHRYRFVAFQERQCVLREIEPFTFYIDT